MVLTYICHALRRTLGTELCCLLLYCRQRGDLYIYTTALNVTLMLKTEINLLYIICIVYTIYLRLIVHPDILLLNPFIQMLNHS